MKETVVLSFIFSVAGGAFFCPAVQRFLIFSEPGSVTLLIALTQGCILHSIFYSMFMGLLRAGKPLVKRRSKLGFIGVVHCNLNKMELT